MNASIFTPTRMHQAFAKVRRNCDCAGADGLTPAVYSLELDARLGALQRAIENGTYQPQPAHDFLLLCQSRRLPCDEGTAPQISKPKNRYHASRREEYAGAICEQRGFLRLKIEESS